MNKVVPNMSAKIKKLNEILKTLERNSEIEEVALISLKGQVMSANLHQDTNEKAIAAMSATIASVGRRVGSVLKAGDTNSITINGANSIVILNHLSSAVIIATAPADAKIGLIDYELTNAGKQIEEFL